MRKKFVYIFLVGILLASLLLPLIPANAAVFTIPITISETTGTPVLPVPLLLAYNTSGLTGSASSTDFWDGLATSALFAEGVTTRYGMASLDLGGGGTEYLGFYLNGGIGSYQSRAYQFKMGVASTAIWPILTGVGGFVTTAHDANLALGSNFDLSIEHYFYKTDGAGSTTILDKAGSFTVTVSNSFGAYTFSSPIWGSIVGFGSDTGLHTIRIYTSAPNVWLSLDGVNQGSRAIGAGIDASGNDFVLGDTTGIGVPYISEVSLTTGGIPRLVYNPSGPVGDDTIDNNLNPGVYTGAITWGANPANITVTAGTLVPATTPTATPGPSIIAKTPTIAGYYETTGENPALPWYELFSRAATGTQVYTTGTATGVVGTKTLTVGGGGSWPLGDSWKGYSILLNGDANYYVVDYVNAGGQIILTTNLLTSPTGATYRVGTASLGWSSNQLYGVMALFAGAAIGVGVAIATGSLLLAGVAVGVGLAMGAGQGVLGWWIVIVYGIIASAYIMVSKSS